MGESSLQDSLFCWHQHLESVHDYSETRSRSNVWKEHTEGYKCDKTHLCCRFWVYSLCMALFGWFWWYLWPKMVYRMSQEFPTTSLDITNSPLSYNLKGYFHPHQKILKVMMKWCLMSSDVGWHIRDKLRPMPKHGSINLYVHGSQKAR